MNSNDFYSGYIAGLTAYARECGHSTLKSDNDLLRRLMDEGKVAAVEASKPQTGYEPRRNYGASSDSDNDAE